jgi:8-oxo-dGTP pyrophosphatase MutT (NUDIX family)
MHVEELTLEEIIRRIESYPEKEAYDHFPSGMLKGVIREAAVLILLREVESQWHLQFIRRTEVDGDIHSGQVAFPGGGREIGDETIIQTALRETVEEIGVDPEQVRILGKLRDFITISNYKVTPVIGYLNESGPKKIQEREVARTFSIPLSWLAESSNREIRKRTSPAGHDFQVIYFKEYDGEILWGASAGFLIEFLEMLEL